MQEIYRIKKKTQIWEYGNLILLLPVILFLIAIILDSPRNIFYEILNIIVHSDILLTDYIQIGGLSAAFMNSSFIGLFNIMLMYILKLKINGALLAALFTIMGFSLMGKNVFNILPMYVGGLLYAKHQKMEFKDLLVVMMFSTSIAPIVSEVAFSLNLSLGVGIITGVFFGIVCGFIITPLSSHLVRIHEGYNLYNIGFTAGVIGTILNSILKGFNIELVSQENMSHEYDLFLKIFLLLLSLILIIIGFIINNKSFKGYGNILKHSGRLVTDFTQLEGFGVTYINIGIMGLVSLFIISLFNTPVNGPIIGGAFTVMGFSAMGIHPKNAIPIMIGVAIAGYLPVWDLSSTSVLLAALFGTTLAPIAGRFGFISGVVAGFLHLCVVMNIGVIHGGINLYNNGFSGGLVAAAMLPILDSLNIRSKNAKRRNTKSIQNN